MEFYDLYNEDREKTGQILERKYSPPEGLCRTTVHICIFNSKGEMLIQQRAKIKRDYPEKWDVSVGGCVIAGETSKQGAQRELKEELGLEHDFSKERPLFTLNFPKGFDDFYVFVDDLALEKAKFEEKEVQAAKWATKEEINQMIESKEFIQFHPSVFDALFEMKDKPGALREI